MDASTDGRESTAPEHDLQPPIFAVWNTCTCNTCTCNTCKSAKHISSTSTRTGKSAARTGDSLKDWYLPCHVDVDVDVVLVVVVVDVDVVDDHLLVA